MLISSQNTLTNTPRIMVNQITGHFMPQWSWLIKLTITNLFCSGHWVHFFRPANGIWIALERMRESKLHWFLFMKGLQTDVFLIFSSPVLHAPKAKKNSTFLWEWLREKSVYCVWCSIYCFLSNFIFPTLWIRYLFLHWASTEIQITAVPRNFRQSIDNCRHIRR